MTDQPFIREEWSEPSTEQAVFTGGRFTVAIDKSGVWTLAIAEPHHALELTDLRCLGAVVTAAKEWKRP